MTSYNSINDYYLKLLQQAAFMNSAGVTALMSGEHSADSCLQVFNEALGLMELVSQCPTLAKVGNDVPCVWNTVSLETTGSDASANSSKGDDRFFVCSQALLFHPNYNKHTMMISCCDNDVIISEVDLSFYSAIIIFNMALTYHQTAMQQACGESVQVPLLHNAMQLYDHCYQILNTILSPPGDDTDMLKLVTLNNQAQISYVTFHDYPRSQLLLNELKKLCPILLLSHHGHATPANSSGPFYSTQTLKEVSMNALLVTGPPSAAACA